MTLPEHTRQPLGPQDAIRRARAIANTGPKIAYNSGVSAEYVRQVVRDLLKLLDEPGFDTEGGRNVVAAARELTEAADAWLEEVAHRDPSMIRDVACSLLWHRAALAIIRSDPAAHFKEPR